MCFLSNMVEFTIAEIMSVIKGQSTVVPNVEIEQGKQKGVFDGMHIHFHINLDLAKMFEPREDNR
jgi:hypothetical protein